MPAEAQRFSRGVGPRDRVVIAAVTMLVATTLAVALAVAELRSGSHGATCVSFAAAGVMGGGTWRLCGQDAVAYCAGQATGPARDRRCAELAVALASVEHDNDAG